MMRSTMLLGTARGAMCRSQPVCRAAAAPLRTFATNVTPAAVGPARSVLSGMSTGRKLAAGLAMGGLGLLTIAGISGVNASTEQAMSMNQAYIATEAAPFPEYVRARLSSTFWALGGGMTVTAAAALGFVRSPTFMRFAAANPIMFFIGSAAATFGGMIACRSVHPSNTALKLGTFGLFTIGIASMVTPVLLMPAAGRAAAYTAGIVGGLSLVAANAPSEQFLQWGGALGMGLGAVVLASVGGMFFPQVPLLHNIALYGGLALFSAFVLYDVQKVIVHAKALPDGEFDPYSECMGVYMDAVNIFIRLAQIMSGSRRK